MPQSELKAKEASTLYESAYELLRSNRPADAFAMMTEAYKAQLECSIIQVEECRAELKKSNELFLMAVDNFEKLVEAVRNSFLKPKYTVP